MQSPTTEGPITRNELTKADFVVRGQREGTFRYPFDSRHQETAVGMSEHLELGSPFGFELSDETAGAMFVAPDFDIRETIAASRGAIVEVAGPTPDGYQSLERVDLPSKPIITNIASGVQRASRGLSTLDKLTLDTMADARALPFRDESVSVLTTSCLVKLNTTKYDHLSYETKSAAIGWEVNNLYTSAIEKAEQSDEAALLSQAEIDMSPRVALWHEATRVLEPRGLFIMRGVIKQDIRLAAALGFELVAHTPLWKDNDKRAQVPYECVFRRTAEGDKPAGKSKARRSFGHAAMQKLGHRK